MEQEISSGTMLGIVLIALAAVIGLGFGVFSIAKGVANEGTVGVQDNLGSVSDSAFDDYNDKIVTGTMVKSAVQNFKGKSVAIFINTVAMDKLVVAYDDHIVNGTVNSYLFTNGASGEFADAVTTQTNKALSATAANISGGEHFYINYNALFDAESEGTITLKDGIYNVAGIPFAVDTTGKVKFDYSVGGQSRTGNCEYLNATAKFDANLMKDDSGTTVGIVFTQRAQ